MADRDSKAGNADSNRAQNQSALKNSETTGRDTSLTDHHTDDPETGESADWGFEAQSSGLATETKIGLGLIVVLLMAFAFVVYRKIDMRNQMAAAVEEADTVAENDPDQNKTSDSAVPPLATPGQGSSNPPLGQQSEPENASDEWNAFEQEPVQNAVATSDSEDPFDQSSSVIPTAAQQDSETASSGADSGELFDPFESSADAGESNGPAATETETLDDAFEPVPATIQPGEVAVSASDESADGTDEPFDPLGPAAEAGAAQTDPQHSPQEPFDPFDEPAVIDPGSNEPSESPFDKTDTSPQQDSPGTTPEGGIAVGFEPIEENEPSQLPKTLGLAPVEGSGNRVPIAGQPSVPARGPIQIYEVRKGDNYWSISRRMYGSARYFLALDRANRHRIKDPTKMRAGMKVLIPEAAELERNNPDLFKPKGQTAAYRGQSSDQTSGFFLSADGQPLYRIGKTDTLSGVALKHLGRSSRWIQIFELNRKNLKSPDDLRIGTVLQLPSDASQVRLIR